MILILFLLNVRTTLITLTAIPLSLAAGLQALNWMDMTVNVMTLGGLAIAVGSLVLAGAFAAVWPAVKTMAAS